MAGVTPLIFLHIPKTAGTTVHHILHNEYRGQNFFTSGHYKDIEKFEKLNDSEKKKIRILKGHFPFGVHKIYPTPITYFTFLREPLKRSISDFNFLLLNHTHPFYEKFINEKYTLKDLLKEGPIKNFDNCQVRYLAAVNDIEYGCINEEIYKIALKNFDEYCEAFGICERFDDSIIYLKHELNWSNPFYIEANVTKKKSYVSNFDEETYQLLNQYNKYDLLLYDYAFKKFDAIIKSKGELFSKEVKRFQKLNSLQAPLRKFARNIYRLFQKANQN
jgi:hypothetical protein